MESIHASPSFSGFESIEDSTVSPSRRLNRYVKPYYEGLIDALARKGLDLPDGLKALECTARSHISLQAILRLAAALRAGKVVVREFEEAFEQFQISPPAHLPRWQALTILMAGAHHIRHAEDLMAVIRHSSGSGLKERMTRELGYMALSSLIRPGRVTDFVRSLPCTEHSSLAQMTPPLPWIEASLEVLSGSANSKSLPEFLKIAAFNVVASAYRHAGTWLNKTGVATVRKTLDRMEILRVLEERTGKLRDVRLFFLADGFSYRVPLPPPPGGVCISDLDDLYAPVAPDSTASPLAESNQPDAIPEDDAALLLLLRAEPPTTVFRKLTERSQDAKAFDAFFSRSLECSKEAVRRGETLDGPTSGSGLSEGASADVASCVADGGMLSDIISVFPDQPIASLAFCYRVYSDLRPASPLPKSLAPDPTGVELAHIAKVLASSGFPVHRYLSRDGAPDSAKAKSLATTLTLAASLRAGHAVEESLKASIGAMNIDHLSPLPPYELARIRLSAAVVCRDPALICWIIDGLPAPQAQEDYPYREVIREFGLSCLAAVSLPHHNIYAARAAWANHAQRQNRLHSEAVWYATSLRHVFSMGNYQPLPARAARLASQVVATATLWTLYHGDHFLYAAIRKSIRAPDGEFKRDRINAVLTRITEAVGFELHPQIRFLLPLP